MNEPIVFGHFRVVKNPDGSPFELGRGAMGVTYKANDERLRIDVALKVIQPSLTEDPKARALFLREARAAARVHHANVASVVFLNDTPGNFFYAMEFVAGESLQDWLRRRGVLPVDMSLGFAAQIARGLAAIHGEHIIHRDLKPANIMIVRAKESATRRPLPREIDPDAWLLKIIDFGLARAFEGEHLSSAADAHTTGFRGTALYASPEQCEENVQIDGRSDQYALGCILWEMLMAKPPFGGRNHRELLNQHVTASPPLGQLTHLPSSVRAVLARMLLKDPAMRFSDDNAAAAALEAARIRSETDPVGESSEGDTLREESTPSPYRAEGDSSPQPTTGSVANVSSTPAIAGPRAPRRALTIGIALFGAALVLGSLALWQARWLPAWASTNASGAQVGSRSIAVLPFENASNDPNAEYLADGISEALINSLTELRQLKVIARSTAFHYKGKVVDPRRVGRELQVGVVLTGRVRLVQDALTVQVDLVDATTGAQVWGAGYDRKLSDVIAVKQAIAREITDKLKMRLSGEEQRRMVKRDTTDAEAYQAYLRGRYFWNKRTPDDLNRAIAQFERAIQRDPNYALGYVGLADSYLLLQQYAGVPSSEAMPKARAAADRALQIDDSLAEAHASSGLAYQFNWQWAEAEEEFRRAISLNGNYATAHHWFCTSFLVKGQWDNASEQIKRARELDPLSPIINANMVIILLAKNDISAAVELCQKIIDLDPNHPTGHDWLGWTYCQAGRYPEAIKERELVAELSQRSGPQLAGVGYVYAMAGRRTEALEILRDLEARYARGEGVGQHMAAIWDGLGDRDLAFAWLEKDFQQHSAELQHIVWRVQFRSLRADPRYSVLLGRMGLRP